MFKIRLSEAFLSPIPRKMEVVYWFVCRFVCLFYFTNLFDTPWDSWDCVLRSQTTCSICSSFFEFLWASNSPIVRSRKWGVWGVNFPVSCYEGRYLWALSCTIDKVLLLHSVVLPKMVVRSVHEERKWETSRGNEQVLYCSYQILKRFLNFVPAFCAKGHKSHKLWSLQCFYIWQKILLRRTRDAGLHWKRWTYSEWTL